MNIINSKNLLTISLFSVLFSSGLFSQSLKEIRITNFYRGTELTKVLTGLQKKYGLKIEYDEALLLEDNLKFDDRSRFGWDGATVEEFFDIVCDDFKKYKYYIDENNVVHLIKKGAATQDQRLSEKKYTGKSGRSNITVSGRIKDKQTGETLPFANVSVKGTTNGTSTSIEGFFTLFKVPSDISMLEFGYMGYNTKQLYLTPDKDLSNLIIYLEPNSTALAEVVVVEESEELMQSTKSVSVLKMSPKKLAQLPSIGEKDIFRAFQLMPGVSGSNESSSGLYVRGGTPGQNLILYDGFTVYHVDHLFGMFSAFNSNAVKDIQLHKGGFESAFGGRISSVMEIVGKDGNENEFNIGGDIGLLSGNIFIETPIGEKVTVLVAGRRSWQSFMYDAIFNSFRESAEEETTTTTPTPPSGKGGRGGKTMESTTPTSYFYDLNAKVTYKPTSNDIISYSFFNGEDDLDNSSTINRSRNGINIYGGKTDVTRWGNWGMSTTWYRKWSDTYFSDVLVSVSNYFSESEVMNSRTMTDSSGDATEIRRGTIEDNNLRDYTMKMNNEWKISENNQLEFGLQASYYNIDYFYSMNDTITIQDRNDKGMVLSMYAQDKIEIGDKLSLFPGIRTSYYDVTDQVYFEPRASFQYKLNNKVTVKGAWGHYYQFTNRIVRNDLLSGSRDFWLLSDNKSIPVSFAEHFIAGASYETNNYLFDVEAYYKNLDGLSEYSLQNSTTSLSTDFDEYFYKGNGNAKGLDFLVQKKFGNYTGWVAYTLSEVLYDFPELSDNEFYANHDTTHEFKIVNSYKHKDWVFSATWIYATGKPYTEPIGGYTITLPSGIEQDYLNIGEKNGARYPNYHRLDLSATYGFSFGNKGRGNINFSVFNFYNNTNVWYKQFEMEEGELIETDVNLLGFTPSITLSFQLK